MNDNQHLKWLDEFIANYTNRVQRVKPYPKYIKPIRPPYEIPTFPTHKPFIFPTFPAYQSYDTPNIPTYRPFAYPTPNLYRPYPFPTFKPFIYSNFPEFPTIPTFPTFSYPNFVEKTPRTFTSRTVSKDNSVGFIGLCCVLLILFVMCFSNKKAKKSLQNDDVEANLVNIQNPQTQSTLIPNFTIITENSMSSSIPPHLTSSPPLASPSFTSSVPLVESFSPQSQRTNTHVDTEDDVPKYEEPPNYDEAMKLIGQQKQELFL